MSKSPAELVLEARDRLACDLADLCTDALEKSGMARFDRAGKTWQGLYELFHDQDPIS